MERDAQINMRCPAKVKQAVQLAADADHERSLSGMIVRILREWCEANGYLRAQKTRKKAHVSGSHRPGVPAERKRIERSKISK